MASTATVAAPHHHMAAPAEPTGLWSWITTVDHKRIGIMYGVTAFIFFLIGGIEALLIRVQLAVPNNNFVSADFYNQLFTVHALTMIFAALMPLTAAFFNYIMPLQIGARDVAFPRLNALSYWVYLFGVLFFNAGIFMQLGPNSGWFAYAPITTREFSPGLNMDFYVLGLQILGLSSILSSLNFIVTIVNMRAPGMRLMRMPIFTWMTLITAILIVTAMAVFTIAVTQLMFDRVFGSTFFNIREGADPLLWQHLFWMFGHPEVYILILPIMGMVSEVLPTFSRKPLFGYNVMVFSGVLIGWLGWGVWSHHMFATGMGPIADSFFSLSTMLIGIPTGIKIFNWLGTLWGGSLRFTTAMLFSIAFIAMFTIGGISGVMHSAAPSDLQQTDTYFVVAHLHYVFFGGTVLGLWSGIYYWFPKITGRLLDERAGQAHFWLTLVGMNLTFFPMHFLGMLGMPRRIFTYGDNMGFNGMNLVITFGAFIIALGTLIFGINMAWSWKRGRLAGANPWGASTLEWAISSPPPVYNFATIPVVHSRMPLWESDATKQGGIPHGRVEEETEQVTLLGTKVGEVRDPESDVNRMSAHDLGIHLPPPSVWPIIMAAGISSIFIGLLFRHVEGWAHNLWMLSVVGALTLVVSIYAWAFEPGHSHP
ncbi:cytochrome c oxidase subunit I [Longimicrobium sp.]|uniref:cytochrome c oxidase subunit I n=1 Tax=Longimicrobium sp. TaxID=2029185 RepID=UPI002E30A480|nr:cytochrome c oxidase subunit I [Longimicrobium sp.]HEX6040753.1 cytochrome c oxidase subunit I [Longimicrobium sp.]